MSKVNIKKLYETVKLEADYGITTEEVEKKEKENSTTEDTNKDDKPKEKVTADSIVKDMMKLEPSQLLKFISKQEDSDAKAWLLKNLISFAKYTVKNGYVKGKALVGAVKDIGNKNKEDETGIDYDNIEIDEASLKTKYAFDEETTNKLKKFIDDYKKEMESAKDDVEKSCSELDKDIKKAGVKIEGDKLADNALTVASVIDDDKNKGKSGKELTKIVDDKISTKNEFNKLEKKADEIKKNIDKTKVDQKYEKMSIEDLDKVIKDNEKSSNDKNVKKESIDETIISEDSKTAIKTGAKMVDVGSLGSGLIDSKGNGFIASDMMKLISGFDDMLDDGKIDPSEYKKLMNFENRLAEYQMWAAENANSKDPAVLAKVALVNAVAKKFDEFLMENFDEMSEANDEAKSLAKRVPEATNNSKQVAKMANNEETKKVTKGFMGKLGKVLRVFGQAKIVAKFGKFILNDGKAGIDAIGGQYVKFKEDQNVVAEMEFILMNAKDSKSKHSDTKFSCRFDTSDMKWHMTNLDDRKQKIEKEDVLIKKILEQEESKKFKEECLKSWTEIFEPKDEASKFIPYFIKNYDKLGIEIKDKNMKKYFGTLQKLVSNFNEVKKQFN